MVNNHFKLLKVSKLNMTFQEKGEKMRKGELLFSLAVEPTEKDKKNLAELNELLAKSDISIDILKNEYGTHLIINCDTDEVKKKLSRNAGRRKKSHSAILVSEIEERMAKGESADDIASELGISRSTLFRRLKESKEWNELYLF